MDKTGRSPTTVAATFECFRCGGNHYANKCNFQDRTCHACGKKGHLARVCRSSKRALASTQDGRRKNYKPPSKDPPCKHTTHTIGQLEPCLMEEDQASSD